MKLWVGKRRKGLSPSRLSKVEQLTRQLTRVRTLALSVCLSPLLGMALSCGLPPTYPSETPQTEVEQFALAETARFSQIAGQAVTGSITEACHPSGCNAAAAWYVGQVGRGAKGESFFYRPWLSNAAQVDVSWAAAHEVCHSITGFAHDERHAWCNQVLFYGGSPW